MIGSTRFLATLAISALLALAAMTAGATATPLAMSCGIVSAAGHAWIVVSKGVSCTSAKNVTRAFAARTAALRAGQKHTVPSPLAGFTCVISNHGKPAGSCAAAGATKTIIWLIA